MEFKLTKSKYGGVLNKTQVSSKKKCIISGITGLIIGVIITGGIGVVAITMNADQIKYTPSNDKFTATNMKEAMDEIYKIAEYEIPKDTYFYDSTTEGEEIVRYKKVDGKYYLCDGNGKITDETEQDVSDLRLIEYISSNAGNISAGSAGYANNSFYLGQASDGMKKIFVGDLETSGNISSIIPDYRSLTIDNLVVSDVSTSFKLTVKGLGRVDSSRTYKPAITSYDPETGDYTATNIGAFKLSNISNSEFESDISATVSAKLYVVK